MAKEAEQTDVADQTQASDSATFADVRASKARFHASSHPMLQERGIESKHRQTHLRRRKGCVQVRVSIQENQWLVDDPLCHAGDPCDAEGVGHMMQGQQHFMVRFRG